MPHDPYKALYLHIPFCVKRCNYCDFATRAVARDSPEIDEYVEQMVLELFRKSKEGELASIETVYLGGGTPSYLGNARLGSLLYALSCSLNLSREGMECTLEANPESIDERMIKDLWALGVNRISIGVQSFSDSLLGVLGRAHTADEARAAITCAQQRFENVSVDLMCGLPGQTDEMFAESIREALALGVTHISVYPLTIEEHTPFYRAMLAGQIDEPDDDVEARQMQLASSMLTEAGLYRYEVANYAKPGFESKHNCAYWQGVPYLGLGTSACTMTQNSQRRMRVVDGQVTDDLDRKQMEAEDIMLAMRMSKGASEERVACAQSFIPKLANCLAELESLGFIEHAEGAYRPTELGWLCGNELYGRLLELAP